MAGENLGSVYYTVDADTSAMLQAEAQINKSLEGVVKDFKVADKAVTDFMKTQAALGRTINSSGQVFSKSGKVIVSASNDYRVLAAAANAAKSAAVGMNNGFTKTAAGVQKGMNGMKGAAQNFSYQIQDIAVQLAGGQNPILIMAQQLPQMLVGMGAAAAGIGALVAVVGGLFLAFGNSADKLESFQKAIESMQASITIGASGIAEYTEQMKILAGLSETLAKIKIAALIGEQKQAYKDGAKSLQEYTADVAGFVRGFGSLESTVAGLTGKKLGSDGYDEAAASMKEFRFAVGAFNADQTVESVEALEAATLRFSAAGADSTVKGRELSARVVELITAFRTGELSLKALNDALKDNSLITGDSAAKAKQYADTVNQMVASLKLETETLGTSDRAKALHVAWMNKATQAQLNEINAAYNAIEAQERKEKAEKDSKSETEKNTKSIAAVSESLEDQRAKLEKTAEGFERYTLVKRLSAAGASKEVIAANLAELKSLQNLRAETELMSDVDDDNSKKKKDEPELIKSVTDLAASPIAKLQAEQKAKYDLIAEYEELETANHQIAVDARAAADREYEANKMAALEQMFVNESEMNALIIGSLDSLQSASTNVFSGLLSQTMTAKEAVSAFSNAIVNELIGSLVSVGLQYVKNAIISQSADKAMLASQLASKAVAATTHTAAVAATVTELVALGAAGAFASTAAIPLVGPALAPAASASAAAAIGAVGSAAIAAAPIAGMRLYGGYTAPNSMYKVNENGQAEMFSDGKNDFLMTGGSGGKVTSASDLGGGQPIINITTINNAAGTDVQVQQSTSNGQTDVKFIIDTVAGNIVAGGKIRNSITRSTTAKSKVV